MSKEVVGNYCNIADNDLFTFYAYLGKAKILEPYLYKIYRLKSKLDCSILSHCIANHIDKFLADRFAYTFALEELCMSLEKANSATNRVKSNEYKNWKEYMNAVPGVLTLTPIYTN